MLAQNTVCTLRKQLCKDRAIGNSIAAGAAKAKLSHLIDSGGELQEGEMKTMMQIGSEGKTVLTKVNNKNQRMCMCQGRKMRADEVKQYYELRESNHKCAIERILKL